MGVRGVEDKLVRLEAVSLLKQPADLLYQPIAPVDEVGAEDHRLVCAVVESQRLDEERLVGSFGRFPLRLPKPAIGIDSVGVMSTRATPTFRAFGVSTGGLAPLATQLRSEASWKSDDVSGAPNNEPTAPARTSLRRQPGLGSPVASSWFVDTIFFMPDSPIRVAVLWPLVTQTTLPARIRTTPPREAGTRAAQACPPTAPRDPRHWTGSDTPSPLMGSQSPASNPASGVPCISRTRIRSSPATEALTVIRLASRQTGGVSSLPPPDSAYPKRQ